MLHAERCAGVCSIYTSSSVVHVEIAIFYIRTTSKSRARFATRAINWKKMMMTNPATHFFLVSEVQVIAPFF